MSKMIALDSNMLLAIPQFKVDVFSEIKRLDGNVNFVIPIQIKNELINLSNKSIKMKKACEIIFSLMKQNNVTVKKVNALNADNALLELSKKGIAVATNDKELKRRIKIFGGEIFFLRKKKFIEKTGGVN